MINRLRCQPQSDSGATLILVMVLIFTVSVTSVAILAFSYTTLRAAATTGGVAEDQYDQDAAMSTAVNAVRNTNYDNLSGESCDPVKTVGPNLGSNYVTTCAPKEGTGGVTGKNSNNTPASALLTLRDTDDESGGIQRTGNGYIGINGQVYSRSSIANTSGATNAIELSTGQAFARAGCTPGGAVITSTPPKDCNTVLNPAGSTDPGWDYANPPGDELVPATLPSCSDDPDVIEFDPGYYYSAAALTNIFSSCPTRMFWFKPGKYYFDFKDGLSRWNAASPIWTINNASTRMVAGKPDGWSSTDSNPQPTFPGACVPPADDANNDGVEFVFGGRSQLVVSNGKTEICGQYRSNRPTGALGATRQFPASVDMPSTPQTTVSTVPAADGGCSVAMAGRGNLAYADDTYGTATLANGGRSCVDLGGFSPAAVIPKGSVLVNATLAVRYNFAAGGGGNLAAGSFTVTPKDAGGSSGSAVSTTTTSPNGTMTYRFADVTSGLYDQVASGGYSGSDIRYEQSKATNNTRTLQVDTVQLTLDWIPPVVMAQSATPYGTFAASGTRTITVAIKTGSGPTDTSDQAASGIAGNPTSTINCVSRIGFPGSGRCAFLAATGNNTTTRLFVRGTVYAPDAAMHIRSTQIDAPVVDTGVIVRKLYLQGATTDARATAMFATQPYSAGNLPLEVYAWTFRCTASDAGQCYADPVDSQPGYPYLSGPLWTLVGTTQTRYKWAGSPSTSGNRDVDVLSWQYVDTYESP